MKDKRDMYHAAFAGYARLRRLPPTLWLLVCIACGTRASEDIGPVSSTDTPYPTDLWQSETFRKQFIGTYACKAAVEPKLAEYEHDVMKKVLGLMADGDLDAVLEVIENEVPLAKAAYEAEQKRQKELEAQQEREKKEQLEKKNNDKEDHDIDKSLYGFIKRQVDKQRTAHDAKEGENSESGHTVEIPANADAAAEITTVDPVDSNDLVPSDDYSAMFDYIAGNVHFQRGRLDEAAACYSKALEKFPTYLRAHKNLGIVQARGGQYQSTIESLTQAVELGENSALVYGLLGYAYSGVAQNLSAESAFRLAILLEPTNADWKRGLIRALFGQERYAEAVTLCNQIIAENPERPVLWRLQASAYLGMNQPLEAANNYEFLRVHGHATATDLKALGDIYLRNEMTAAAVEAYADALKAEGELSPASLIINARILAQQGAPDDARQLLKAIAATTDGQLSEKDSVEVLRLRARLAMEEGATDRQAKFLEEILETNPTDGQALIEMGRYYANRNKPDMAIFYYERAQGIDEWEAMAKIRHAQLLVQEAKYKEAIPLLESALKIKYRDQVSDYLAQVKAAAKSAH